MRLRLRKRKKFTFLREGPSGKTLIMLHGMFGAVWNFKWLFDHLKNDYDVIVLELPVHGGGPSAKVQDFTEFLHEFITQMGLKNVTLIGNSFGGLIAADYNNSYPEEVLAMVLISPAGLEENSVLGDGKVPRRDREKIKEIILKTFYDARHVTEKLLDEVMAITTSRRALYTSHLFQAARKYSVRNFLSNFKLPVMIIGGENDEITPPYVMEEFNSKIQGSELYIFPKCCHAAHIEVPPQVYNVLNPFLRKVYA